MKTLVFILTLTLISCKVLQLSQDGLGFGLLNLKTLKFITAPNQAFQMAIIFFFKNLITSKGEPIKNEQPKLPARMRAEYAGIMPALARKLQHIELITYS